MHHFRLSAHIRHLKRNRIISIRRRITGDGKLARVGQRPAAQGGLDVVGDAVEGPAEPDREQEGIDVDEQGVGHEEPLGEAQRRRSGGVGV